MTRGGVSDPRRGFERRRHRIREFRQARRRDVQNRAGLERPKTRRRVTGCSASSTAADEDARCIRQPHAPRRRAAQGGVRRRFAPHQLRDEHALELLHEGVPLNVIQRQLGHRNLGVTSIYLRGIDNAEIIETVHARRAPMIPVSTSLRL
jgi:integrase